MLLGAIRRKLLCLVGLVVIVECIAFWIQTREESRLLEIQLIATHLTKAGVETISKRPVTSDSILDTSRLATLPNRIHRSYGDDPARDLVEYTNVKALAQHLKTEARYHQLYIKLGLTEDLQKKLAELLDERDNLPNDLNAALAKAPHLKSMPGSDHSDFEDLAIKSAYADMEDQIKQLLGADVYSQFQDYESHMPQNLLIEELEQQLSSNNLSLSTQQSTSLLDALITSSPVENTHSKALIPMAADDTAPNAGGGVGLWLVRESDVYIDPQGSIVSNCSVNTAVLEKAAKILSTEQMDALQAIDAKQEALRQMAQIYNGR